MAAGSIIQIGPLEEPPPGLGLFFAYGDRDDPQRLVVLLAEHLTKISAHDPAITNKTRVCLDPRASWTKRHTALADALHLAAERRSERFIALADIDALAPRETEDWNADRSVSMRWDIYELVLEAIERGGWLVFRTCPAKSVSPELARREVMITYAPDPPASSQPEETKSFAPEVRPIAAWLVRRGVLSPRDLSRVVADVEDFDAHIVDLAYDALPPVARDAGKLLAAVRPPQHVNGALGPFAYAAGVPTATSIPRAAVDALRASGLLQPGAVSSTLRMPRLVRDVLRRFAPLGMAGPLSQLHDHLAALPIDAEDTAGQLEIHHHAVLAGNVERAKSTARFYGTGLRELARQLSFEGQREKDRAKLLKAADLFSHVLAHFDPNDAYAWEYKGYNLALTNDPSLRDEILHAYEQAHHLWPQNPLYHGRWLGFRGQLGEEIASEVMRWIDRYVDQYGGSEHAVSYFAETALKGLRRGKQLAQVSQIIARKRTLLERFAPQALATLDE